MTEFLTDTTKGSGLRKTGKLLLAAIVKEDLDFDLDVVLCFRKEDYVSTIL